MNIKKSSDKKLAIAIIIIFLIALAIRLSIFDLRLLHSDEGVSAISFVKPLYESGQYRYDPNLTYHGPFLYYLTAFSFHIFGVNEFSLRFFGMLFSSFLVLLIYPLRRYIGAIGSLSAALLIALSPIFTYYSTFSSLHEQFLLFFELMAIILFFLYLENQEKKYLYLFFISLAFMLTTRETAYSIIALSSLFFIISVFPYRKKLLYFLSKNYRHIIFAVIISFLIFATFYTSFFKYSDNLLPTITKAVPNMLKTSEESIGHQKPFPYYTKLLVKFELPLFIFALIGLFYFRKNLFSKFSAYLLVSTWLLFSWVAYKTPWLILHIMLPMAIVAGIGIQGIYRKIGKHIIPILIVALIYMAFTSYDINYINHSSQDNELAYVITTPELIGMVNRIYTFDKDAEIKILSSEYWPLPWYLRDYKKAGYYGKIIDNPDADIIIVKKEDKEKLLEKVKNEYEIEDYQLRYGVWLTAFYRK